MKKINRVPTPGMFALFALSIILTSCNHDNRVGPKDKELPETTFVFTRDPSDQPVVNSGTEGWPIFPADPAVIKDNEGYHLFYTTYFCNANGSYYYSWDAADLNACNISDVITTIGYAFSSDMGYTWEFRGSPVLMPGNESWNCGDIETPHVAIWGDTLYLFSSVLGEREGKSFSNRFQIGAAMINLNGATIRERLLLEPGGFTWTSEPILPYNTMTSSFDNNTQEPSVVIKNDTLELFYIGLGMALPDQPLEAAGQSITSIGLAKASFKFDLQLIAKSNGYLLPGANITEIKYFDDYFHVFSTTLDEGNGEFHQDEKINYFRSPDGINWSPAEILLAPAAEFDGWGMMAPTVVVEEDKLVMFYTGWSIENHPCFPEPFTSDVRFGRPSGINESKCIYGSIGRAIALRQKND